MVAQLRDLPAQAGGRARSMACCGCSRSTATGTRPSRPIRKACGRRCCWRRRCCTIPISSCWMSLFPGSTWRPALVLRSLIQELAARGKVILFSSHELETVERVCSRVVILHRGKIVADDSIERLRMLMALPTLEEIFSQLAVEQDTAAVSREIADLILSMTKVAISRALSRVSVPRSRSGTALAAGRHQPNCWGSLPRVLVFLELRSCAAGHVRRRPAYARAQALLAALGHGAPLIATTMLAVGLVRRAELGFRISRTAAMFWCWLRCRFARALCSSPRSRLWQRR